MKGLFSRIASKLGGRSESPAHQAALDDAPAVTTLLDNAMAAYRRGDLTESRSIYQRVVNRDPSNFDALHMLGVLALQQGNATEAIRSIGLALEAQPGNPMARTNLALVYRGLGRLAEAEQSLRVAIRCQPPYDRAQACLGLVLRDRGNLVEAESALVVALQLDAGNDEAHSNLASIYRETGRYKLAETHYREAINLIPERAEYWRNLAALYMEREEWSAAESCLRAINERGAASAESLSHLGLVLLQLDRLDEAEAACREALAVNASFPDAWVNLATVQQATGNLAAADESCQRALAIDGQYLSALISLGSVRNAAGDARSAEELYRRVIELAPDNTAANYNLSGMLLMRGAYSEGFALADHRFQAFKANFRRQLMQHFLDDDARRWRGGAVAGRHVVVWAEQGYGDNLMMLRYAPLLKANGAQKVTYICDPEFARVAGAVAGIDHVITGEQFAADAPYDLHCPTMSLPLAFATTRETVPAPRSYIAIPPAIVAVWHDRIRPSDQRSIGLVWAGNQELRDHAKRSIPLSVLLPLLEVAGTRFFSLQKGVRPETSSPWHRALIDHMDLCNDFVDTGGLINQLDLVITIDTAVAHLAGAMGKPVWLLNRAGGDWRWGPVGESTPWYPSVRIFRQERDQDWVPAVRKVVAALAEFVASPR